MNPFWGLDALGEALSDLVGGSEDPQAILDRIPSPPQASTRGLPAKDAWIAAGIAALGALLGDRRSAGRLAHFLWSADSLAEQQSRRKHQSDLARWEFEWSKAQAGSRLKNEEARRRQSASLARERLAFERTKAKAAQQREQDAFDRGERQRERASEESRRKWELEQDLRREELRAREEALWARQKPPELVTPNLAAAKAPTLPNPKTRSAPPQNPEDLARDRAALGQALSRQRILASRGVSTTYYRAVPNPWRDRKGQVHQGWRPEETARGRAAIARLKAMEEGPGLAVPIDPTRAIGGAFDPQLHSWAIRPIHSAQPSRHKKR